MNQATNRKPTSSEIKRILLEYNGPRITVRPGTNNIVLTDSFDRLRTVTWGGIYKLAIDGFTVTGRDIFQALLTPGQFECIRAVSEPDDRTASFLDEATKTIGLVGHEEDHEDDETEHNRPIAATVHFDQDLDADLGMNRSGQWVVQWRTGTTAVDTVITRARFAKSSGLQNSPSRQDVETARLIISIRRTLPEMHFRPDFQCLDCCRYCPHWLDIAEPSIPETPIQARWKAFLDRSCGCHRSPSIVVEEF